MCRLGIMTFLLIPFKGFCGDSLFCFEISSSGALVESAPIDVPAGIVIHIGFESTNTSSELVFSQGYVIETSGKKSSNINLIIHQHTTEILRIIHIL